MILFFYKDSYGKPCSPRLEVNPRVANSSFECTDSCLRGQELFFSKSLSPKGDASCADCHIPEFSFSDKLQQAQLRGRKLWTSRTPSLIDIHRQKAPFFWNGRSQNFESAIFWPLYHPDELDSSDEILKRFGGVELVVKSIAAYLSSLLTGLAPIDRYLAGDCSVLTTKERSGLKQFLALSCNNCHGGTEFDGGMHELSYKNLPENYFIKKEVAYISDVALHDGYKKEMRLISKARSLRNLLMKGPPYGRFGQGLELKEFLTYHVWQLGLSELDDDSDLLEFLNHALASERELTDRSGFNSTGCLNSKSSQCVF